MGEILCAGLAHFPPFSYPDEHMADILRRYLASDRVPEDWKVPARWPEPMVREFGPDGREVATAAAHRAQVISALAGPG